MIKTKSRVTARVTAALSGSKTEAQKTIFRVPKSDEALIRRLKRYLNHDDYCMRVRARGPRTTSPHHTIKANAEWFAIYLFPRAK
jgi:hypothetical protein